MSDEDNCIDLNFYREQIKEFEQEYKDVSLWTKKEKNGEVQVRRMADKVIDAYRTLLNNRRRISEGVRNSIMQSVWPRNSCPNIVLIFKKVKRSVIGLIA